LWHIYLAYYPHLNTTTATESIHRIIQTARRRARGFRNFENLKAVCYRMADRFDLQIPSVLTQPT
jgi:transposase